MSTLYLVSYLVIYLTATGYPQTCDLQSVYYLIVSVGDASRQGWTSRCEPGCMTGGTVLLRSPVWLSEQFSFLSAASRWPPPHSLRVCVCVCVCARAHAQSCGRVLLLATPWTVACQAPLSMEFFQARIPEWVAISFSRTSSQPRDRTHVSCISCSGRRVLYH